MEQPKKPTEEQPKENEHKTALDVALEKQQKIREEIKALKEKFSLKGLKVKVNKVYNELYDNKEMKDDEKIKSYMDKVAEVFKEYQKSE